MKTYNMVKKYGTYVLAASTSMVASSSAFAIAAADLAPITTQVTADMGVVVPWAFGLLALILGAVIGFTLVKKFANKSAG